MCEFRAGLVGGHARALHIASEKLKGPKRRSQQTISRTMEVESPPRTHVSASGPLNSTDAFLCLRDSAVGAQETLACIPQPKDAPEKRQQRCGFWSWGPTRRASSPDNLGSICNLAGFEADQACVEPRKWSREWLQEDSWPRRGFCCSVFFGHQTRVHCVDVTTCQ